MNSFFNDIFRVALTNFFIIVFGISSSIISARYLGPENNGVIAALLVYPGLFMSIGSLGIRQSTTYFLGKNLYSEGEIKTAISQIWLFTTLISLIICFVLMRNFSNSGDNIIWVILALAPLSFSLFNTYNSGIFLGKNDLKTFNKINWIPSFLSFLGIIIFVIGLNLKISGILLASIIGPIFMSLLLLFKNKFIQSFSIQYNWKIIRSMLSLGLVYAISLLVINLNYRIDIIFLDNLSTPFELGIYSKGAGISQYLWQIPMVLSTIVFARSAISQNDKQFSFTVAQLLRLSIILVGAVAFFLILLANFLVPVMFGDDFYNSIFVLQILLPGVVIITIFKVMNMDLAGKGKPWISLKAMIPALFINIALNLFLIPTYGANGAAFSSTISYSIAGILFLVFYSKETEIPINVILGYKKSDFDPLIGIYKKINARISRL